MSQLNQPSNSSSDSDEQIDMQICLWKIADFFLSTWKRLALGGFIGLIGSLLVWFALGNYKAELTIPNRWGDIATMRALENTWTGVAEQIVMEDKLLPEEVTFYKTISNLKWWNKNLTPGYAITKAELKELAGSVEIKGPPIMNLKLSWVGKDKRNVEKNVVKAAEFMRTASSYEGVRKLLNDYESEIFSAPDTIKKEINSTELNLEYANRRLASLEELQKRFSGNTFQASQVVDPKDAGAKYLPISTQLIAAKTDIFSAQDTLKKLSNRLAQTRVLNEFFEKAMPLLSQERDGVRLATQLLGIEVQLRQKVTPNDLGTLLVLDRVRVDLINIQSQYMPKVEAPLYPSVSRASSMNSVALSGLLGGMFVALLFCLYLQYWPAIKAHARSLRYGGGAER